VEDLSGHAGVLASYRNLRIIVRGNERQEIRRYVDSVIEALKSKNLLPSK
jgi:flagellar motor component MotA